jgi:hypothetical protein
MWSRDDLVHRILLPTLEVGNPQVKQPLSTPYFYDIYSKIWNKTYDNITLMGRE